jgi:hypothetical protein
MFWPWDSHGLAIASQDTNSESRRSEVTKMAESDISIPCKEAFPGIDQGDHSYTGEQLPKSNLDGQNHVIPQMQDKQDYLAMHVGSAGAASIEDKAALAHVCTERLRLDDVMQSAETTLINGILQGDREIHISQVTAWPDHSGPNLTADEGAVLAAIKSKLPVGYGAYVHQDPASAAPPTYSIYVQKP